MFEMMPGVLLQLMVSGRPIRNGPPVTSLAARVTRSDREPALTRLRRMVARTVRDRERRAENARRNCLVPVSLRLFSNTLQSLSSSSPSAAASINRHHCKRNIFSLLSQQVLSARLC